MNAQLDMTAPQRVVQSARAYLGTPFMHRGRSKNGIDCAGLARCACKDAGFNVPDYLLYGREPHGGELEAAMERALGAPVMLAPVSMFRLKVGDIVLVRFKIEPHHVAILTDYQFGGLGVIHADGHNGKVVEHRLAEDMVKRITHVFRIPD